MSAFSSEEFNLNTQTSIPSNNRAYATVSILCFVNLLNCMDGNTVAAVLIPIQNYFDIDDSEGGLLQTVFVCSFLIFAPVCGYLGDRYSRKLIMIVGIFIWSSTVLLSSFVQPQHFWMFFVARGIVGIGEASYCTVAPTIIADLFTKEKRSRMLMLFYFAIPIGSGLGFMIGGGVAELMGSWQWGLRIAPMFGVVCWLLLIFLFKDSERGSVESAHNLKPASCKTFIWSTMGFVSVAFVAGAVSLWALNFVIYSQAMQMKPVGQLAITFGIVTCLGGFTGVTVGSVCATRLRRINPDADPLICGIGLLVCMIFYFIAINTVAHNLPTAWVMMFLAVTGLFMQSAVTTDVLMYVVVPSKRSTAIAVQTIFGHLLGDASSPYIIGEISDLLLAGKNSDFEHYLSLKYALFLPAFILVLGSFFFLAAAWFVRYDKKRAEDLTRSGYLDPSRSINRQRDAVKVEPNIFSIATSASG